MPFHVMIQRTLGSFTQEYLCQKIIFLPGGNTYWATIILSVHDRPVLHGWRKFELTFKILEARPLHPITAQHKKPFA